MISYLQGDLLEASPSACVILASGIGFELGISGTTAASLPALGEFASLYVRMQVREDAVALFGFATKDERTMFDRLVAVSGVGPKLALAVLTRFSPAQLYAVVMAEDEKGMSSVSGVGKKTAQRLILELKGGFAKDKGAAWADVPAGGSVAATSATAPTSALDDAQAALLSMGFSPQEAELALKGYDGGDMRVEEILAGALRRLGMES